MESSVLESLECRNDYRSHIRCSWRKNPSLSLSLFHMDPDNCKVAPCVRIPVPSQNAPGQERVFCRYNTSLFAIGFDDVFFFHTPHSPGVSRTYNLTKSNDTKWIFKQVNDILSPSCLSPDCSKTLLTSDPFRQHDHRHTEVDVIHQSANEKVNKIETEGSGMLFDRPTLMFDYELPGPTNLRCVYRGERNVSCSWKLTTDVAQYISYTLSYRTHSSSLGEWCCVDNVEVTNSRGLLRMVGVFSIFEPGVQEVQLTPTPVTRVIHAYKHIQPACPTALCVELSREDWILNWTLPKYRTIRLTSQLEYWSTLTPKDVKTISLPDPVTVFSIPERSLIGSSEYRARVRCSLSMPRRPGQRYAGYPSEWTDLVSWTTQPEPLVPRLVAFVLYFLIATLSVAISVVVFFILVVTQRRLRDWKASLPSPVHSKVSKVRQLPRRDLLTSCRELKDPDISSVQIVGVCPLPSSFDSESAKIEQNQVILHIDDPCVVSTPKPLGGLMRMDLTHCDSAFQPHTFRLSDAVLPCSEGYMQNPATYTDTTQNALQVCHWDTEMNYGYINCIESDLFLSQGKKNNCSLHTQGLNTHGFLPHLPMCPGRFFKSKAF
ncbi:interleukin-3 receptor class 2 subunit beta-like [Triplophysa dalaica]|uniref:interleukin-3 receptor class 2 subunit beta-like n=1 Tax=Triplophysa dalaica TaxID=1582913 RepID=UPI0024DF577F|nr:interleukin-3 receptor class 2 subunit beta-like [Triplophysa dalaica]